MEGNKNIEGFDEDIGATELVMKVQKSFLGTEPKEFLEPRRYTI